MKTIEIMKLVQNVYANWSQEGLFLDYFIKTTGFEFDTKEYELASEMAHDGLLT